MAFNSNINHLYNPKNQPPAELVDGFVVRLRLFERLYQEIANSDMSYPEQHFLIVGKRGMGKTTLLLRLAYEIERHPQLRKWLLPLVFNEEEYGIRRLYNLWERIIELLIEKDAKLRSLARAQQQLSSLHPQDADYEKQLFQIIESTLEEQEKKMILFVDNLGEMFQKFNEQEAHRLRKILQTSSTLRIIGASSMVLESFYEYNYPFYEFFKVERLHGLQAQEARDLLFYLSDKHGQEQVKRIVENQPGRVESLRRLAGGVIRTMILLFEIFIDEASNTALQDLESILDRVTPLYKHRMDGLPGPQQELVEIIALNWDAMSIEEMQRSTRLGLTEIEEALQALSRFEIIRKILTTDQRYLYQLEERFFNIWFLMRHGRRGDKRRVLWLVRFLEEWCDEAELEARVNRQIQKMQEGAMPTQAAFLLSEALAHTRQLSQAKQHELLKATRLFLEQKNSQYLAQLSQSDVDLHQRALVYFENGKVELALHLFLSMRDPDQLLIGRCYLALENLHQAEETLLQAMKKGRIHALLPLGQVYKQQFFYEPSEAYFLEALKFGETLALAELVDLYKQQGLYEKAILYSLQAAQQGLDWGYKELATLHRRLGDYEKAKEYAKIAVEKGQPQALEQLVEIYLQQGEAELGKQYFLEASKDQVKALIHLSKLYRTEQRYDRAEEFLIQAHQQGAPEALLQLGLLYKIQGHYDKAEEFLLKASEIPEIEAFYHLGNLYRVQGRYEEAEQHYLFATEANHLEATADLGRFYLDHQQADKAQQYLLLASERGHVEALTDLGDLYLKKGKVNQAEASFKKAIQKGNVNAYNVLGLLYLAQKKFDEAEVQFKTAAKQGVTKAIGNLGFFYHELQHFEKAEEYYLQSLELIKEPLTINNLAFLYYETQQKRTKALELSAEAYRLNNEPATRLTYAKILAWNENFQQSYSVAQDFLYDEKYLTRYLPYFQDYLLLLMAKKQFAFLTDYFESEQAGPLQLKDRLKPLYFALLYHQQEDQPNAFLRMGPELQETVQEILDKVKEMERQYSTVPTPPPDPTDS